MYKSKKEIGPLKRNRDSMSEVVASAFSNKTKSDLTKHAVVGLEDI